MDVLAVTTATQLADCLAVRYQVFVQEQGVSAEGERDDLDDDPRTVHCVAYNAAGAAIGAGRLLASHTDTGHGTGMGHGAMNPANPHIGRVAVVVSERGTGTGRAIMGFLEGEARGRFGVAGHVRVELSAQDHAMGFYERLGYTAHGEAYLDEGIWHHDAYKDLS